MTKTRRATFWLRLAALAAAACLLSGCGAPATQTQQNTAWKDRTPTHSMELQYAEQFTVDYYEDDLALVTIGGTDRYLVVPCLLYTSDAADE